MWDELWGYELRRYELKRCAGPAMDMGVEYLRKHYSEVFQVRHTYIYDRHILRCTYQADLIEDMLLRFFYKDKSSSNATAVIFPGTMCVAVDEEVPFGLKNRRFRHGSHTFKATYETFSSDNELLWILRSFSVDFFKLKRL